MQDTVEKEHIIDLDADPITPYERMTVIEHTKGGQFMWDPKKIQLFLHDLQKEENGISLSEAVRFHAEVNSRQVFNANLLDYLLDNQHLIPEEWRANADGTKRYVCFWGTRYVMYRLISAIRYMHFEGGVWYSSYFGCVGKRWDAHCPAAILAD
ncbi:MAG: hypothetical protein V4478_01795 [Patescibacteria group bacterium]